MSGRFLAAALAAVLVAAAGCGSEEESSAPAGSATETITITETDFALDPSTVTLEEEGTYTFRVVNDGAVDHALEIEGEGVESETDTIAPGESAEVTVELTGGTFELYCPIDGHADQGMKGSVEVAGGGGGATTGEDEDEGGGGYGY
jgi:plastocyanin